MKLFLILISLSVTLLGWLIKLPVINSIDPTPIQLENNTSPNSGILYFNFTKFPNWSKSVRIKNKFNNYYESDKDLKKAVKDLTTKLLPFAQQNINEIMSGKQKHCHILKEDERGLCDNICDKIHGSVLGQDVEIWQIGAIGSVRLIGPIISGKNTYTMFPLFIDSNHLIYPSTTGSNNKKDYKNMKKCLFD